MRPDTSPRNTGGGSYLQLLKIPKILLICLVVLVISQSLGYLDPTLEPFFRKNGWTTEQVAFAFFILSGTIAILLPLFSMMAQRVNQFFLMISGLVVIFLGILFIGPSHLFNLSPSIEVTLCALVVVSIGYALAFIPTFENILVIAMDNGFADDLSTYGTVSGLWATMFALGYVISLPSSHHCSYRRIAIIFSGK